MSTRAVGLAILLLAVTSTTSAFTAPHIRPVVRPLIFEANLGQHDARVKFVSRGSDSSLFLTSRGAILSLKTADGRRSILQMEFAGVSPAASVRGVGLIDTKSNYLIGRDSARWYRNVPNYSTVEYSNLYRGVDLLYYAHEGQLEYDLRVEPGANPNPIAISFRGGKGLAIDEGGNLVQSVGGRVVILRAPRAYQEVEGERRPVRASFVLKGRVAMLRLGRYDKQRPLIIDPAMTYSTYLGGSSADQANAIAVDAAGNAYICGSTDSADFPVTSGSFQTSIGVGADAFVTKVSTGGSIVYSTYLGGNNSDNATTIAVDATGAAYVAGSTSSTDFPLANAYQSSFSGLGAWFITKLDPTGSALVYSTYLGGSAFSYEAGLAFGIAVDAAGSAYVTGGVPSASFPVQNAFQPAFGGGAGDAYVAKFTPSGTGLVYASYLGGSGYEVATAIAIDGAGNAYVTGFTASTNFPTLNPVQATFLSTTGGFNAFVTKIDATGTALSYSTYLGGSDDDRGFGIAVDAGGSAFVDGLTSSTNFPTANALQPADGGGRDAFLTKLAPSGSTLIYSTFLGGSHEDDAFAIAIDSFGNAYLTGLTASPDFPSVQPMQAGLNGPYNAFVAEVNSAGSALVVSTLLGGNGGDSGQGIAADSLGFVDVTGWTYSSNYPTLNAAQSTYGGVQDAFITRIDLGASTPSADVFITKSAAPNPATTWSSLTYTLAIGNHGPMSATNVQVTDPLPANTTFVSAASTQGTCSGTTAVSCSLGTLANGAGATITIVTTPTAEGQLTNTATVSADQLDLQPANNTSTKVTSVNPPPLFDALGQRADVNDFLRYAAPTQTTTTVPAATTSYSVIIYYGPTVVPSTFSAVLNHAPVVGFVPTPGTSQRVMIPLSSGRNTLDLTVDGVRSDGRTATERDRLVFIVP